MNRPQLKRFRRPFICLLLISLLIVPPIPVWPGVANFPRGDVNQDGYIDGLDVLSLNDLLLNRSSGPVDPAQADFNQDQGIDAADIVSLMNYDGDWDGDNVPDIDDDYPLDPNRSGKGLDDVNLDTDHDGYAEDIDPYRVDSGAVLSGGSAQDSDGDGLSNLEEDSGWTNGAGGPFITDSLLKDTDRDGLDDKAEHDLNTDPLNPDTDGDGVLDGDDADPLNAAVSAGVARLVDREGNPRAPRRLTPEQIRINNAWQAKQQELRAKWRKAAAAAAANGETVPSYAMLVAAEGSSGRGLGFQGPPAVGSNFESVQSDKFTGAFSYTIPIKVPPGRGGFQPDLTLLYRSTHNDSWLGQGWDLNPGRIERSTKDGSPKYKTGGQFYARSRPGARGLESMADHPVVNMSWYGAVAFCNWLSEKEGRTPCYDLSTWQLILPYTNGYRLPTEAEWERAAAWDPTASRHWIYGYTSDTLQNRSCNYAGNNPLGLFESPYTSPVGWYNGINVNPSDGLQTLDSRSPAGCYDMSGNAPEWCQDIIDEWGQYPADPQTDPTGPTGLGTRAVRGGSAGAYPFMPEDCRTARRVAYPEWETIAEPGFRLVTSGVPGDATVSIPAGTFTMGRTDGGDDQTYGMTNEDPRYSVTLSPYQIGKYEVTNGQYADVLNWALEKGYLENADGSPYTGGDVYKNGWTVLRLTDNQCQIVREAGAAPDEDPLTPLDNPDRFVYKTASGDTELVFTGTEVINGDTCRIYHATVDGGSFIRFIYHPDPLNPTGGRWEAWWKDGKKAYFNEGPDPRVSMIAGPDGQIFSWAVEREEDANGNVIEYRYQQPPVPFSSTDQNYSTNDLYLQSVRYNFVDGEPMAEITFDIAGRLDGNDTWASHRENYRPGFKVVSEHFLTAITETVKGRGSVYSGHPERVRKYVLGYYPLDPNEGRTISCLKSVQEFGETDSSFYPPITMQYSESLPAGVDANIQAAAYDSLPQWDGAAFPPPSTTQYRYYLPESLGTVDLGYSNGLKFADYNRDGLLDFVYKFKENGTDHWGVYFNNPDLPAGWEGYREPSTNPYVPPYLLVENDSSNPGPVLGNYVGDLNGDAYPDIAWKYGVLGTDYTHLAINSRSGWESDLPGNNAYNLPFQLNSRYQEVLNDPLDVNADYGARFADFNGDGLVDIVASFEHSGDSSQNQSHAVLNTGAGWTDEVSYIPPRATSYQVYIWDPLYPPYDPLQIDYSGNYYGNFTGDLNGDGLTDLAWRNDFESALALNNGKTGGVEGSSWDYYRPQYDSHPYKLPRPVTSYNNFSVLDSGTRFADVNGDGLVDIIYNSSGSDYGVWLNTGNGWQAGGVAYVPSHFFASHDHPAPLGFLGDIDGDGMTDIAFSWTVSTDTPPNHGALYVHKGQKPNLLTHIDNGTGGAVDVEYTPSTKGWMKLYDPDPTLRVEPDANGLETNKHIPYVMQVVSKITRTGLRPNNIDPANPVTPGTTSQSKTTLYRYSGGQYLDREFRGFGKVKEIDAQTGNFTITEYYQDYARRGQVKSERSYVGHRGDYRVGGVLDGPILAPKDEHVPTYGQPRVVSETHHRYRVVIHEDDPLHLKTFTDTNTKLGLTDFPLGMTLVTPACTLTRTYEYSGDYTKQPQDLDSSQVVVTARETFYDGRGNLVETLDFGRVSISGGATSLDLEQPRINSTFTNDGEDGRTAKMTRYEPRRLGTWIDVPVMTNTAGFYTKDLSSGTRETQSVELQAASEIEYDDHNRVVSATDVLDSGPDPVRRFDYDAFGNLETETDARGNPTSTVYDSIYHAFPSVIVNPAGQVEQSVVDPGTGNLLSHLGVNGHETTVSYDGLGRVTARTNAYGFTFATYDYGFLEESASVSGVYLPNRVRVTAWAPNGGTPAGVWSEKHYDGLGREYEILKQGQRGSSDPIRVVTEFNDRGLPWKVSHPHWVSEASAAHWTYTFLENDDATVPAGEKTWKRMGLSRPVKTVRELGSTTPDASTTIEYETPLSRKSVDARGNERRQVKDVFGDLMAVWEPNEAGTVGVPLEPQGRMTRYGWDALGRLEFVRRHLDKDQYSAADPVTNVTYDSLGRMTSLKDPDTGTTDYRYDANGNLVRSANALGQSVTRTYDSLDRLVRLSYPDVGSAGTLENVYTYDTGGGENLVSRLARVQSPGCDMSFSYDALGNTTLKQRIIDGVEYNVFCDYDAAGRLSRMTYPDGMRLEYAYDPATQALDRLSDPDSGQVWMANVDMAKFDRADLIALGNGVTRTVEFDWAGRANRLQTTLDTNTLSDMQYTFDANSNIARIQELAGPTPRGDMQYRYDALDRLTGAWGTTMSGEAAGDSATPRFRYAYDPLGRMTLNSRFLNPAYSDYTLEYEYSADPSSDRPAHGVRGIRFTKAAQPTVYAHKFTYDAAGNLTASTNEAAALAKNNLDRSYTWDALGRLQSITNAAGTTTFAYDHSGTRVKKTGPTGQSTIYIGDIAEVTPAGMTKHIFAGPVRIATIQPDGTKLFILTDHLRSSTFVTDDSGTVVQRMDYEPYGALIENARSGNSKTLRFTYTGQEDDTETGLMYYGARYYDPVVGMFISPDQLTRRPGDPQRFQEPDLSVAAQTNPQQFNRFAYCGNNPMVYVDETGEFFFIPILIAVVVGAAIGAGAAAIQAAAEGRSFSDWRTWTDIGISAAIGGASGLVGGGVAAGVGRIAAGALARTALKAGTQALIKGAVSGALGGAAGGFVGGIGGGLSSSGYAYGSAGEAFAMGGMEAAIGFGLGGLGGGAGSRLARSKSLLNLEGKAMRYAGRTLAHTGTKTTLIKDLTRAGLQAQYLEKWGDAVEELVIGGFESSVAFPTSPYKRKLADLF